MSTDANFSVDCHQNKNGDKASTQKEDDFSEMLSNDSGLYVQRRRPTETDFGATCIPVKRKTSSASGEYDKKTDNNSYRERQGAKEDDNDDNDNESEDCQDDVGDDYCGDNDEDDDDDDDDGVTVIIEAFERNSLNSSCFLYESIHNLHPEPCLYDFK